MASYIDPQTGKLIYDVGEAVSGAVNSVIDPITGAVKSVGGAASGTLDEIDRHIAKSAGIQPDDDPATKLKKLQAFKETPVVDPNELLKREKMNLSQAKQQLASGLEELQNLGLTGKALELQKAQLLHRIANENNLSTRALLTPDETPEVDAITEPAPVATSFSASQPEEQQEPAVQTSDALSVSPISYPRGNSMGEYSSALSGQSQKYNEGLQDLASQQQTIRESQAEELGKRQAEQIANAQEREEMRKEADTIRAEEIAKQQEQEKQRRDALKVVEDQISQLTNDIRSKKIDENRFWNTKNFGQKLGLIFANILYRAGQGMSGGTSGSSLFDKYMKRDIQAQKDQIAKARADRTEAVNYLDMLRQKFGDERQADSAFYALRKEAAAQKAQDLADKHSDQQKAAELRGLGIELEQAALNDKKAILDAANQNITATIAKEAELAARGEQINISKAQLGLSAEQLKMQKQANLLAAAKLQVKNKEELEKLIVPGMSLSGTKKPTPKEAEKLAQDRTMVQDSLEKVRKLQEHVKEYGWEVNPIPGMESTANVQGKALSTALQLTLKNIFQLGVLSQSDIDMIQRLAPTDPHTFWTSDVLAKLQTIEDLIADGWAFRAANAGYVDMQIGKEKRLDIQPVE